jgi:hypothetical protein
MTARVMPLRTPSITFRNCEDVGSGTNSMIGPTDNAGEHDDLKHGSDRTLATGPDQDRPASNQEQAIVHPIRPFQTRLYLLKEPLSRLPP